MNAPPEPRSGDGSDRLGPDRPDPGRRDPDRSESDRSGGGARRVAGGILVSRVLGLVRDRAFAHFFGSSDFADAWRAALRTPNVVQNLLGEGTLSASLVPVYSEMLEQGRHEEASRFAGAALGLLTLVTGAVVLLGWIVAPLLVSLFFATWAPEKQALTVTLVRILFPMTGVLVLSAWALGILNSHRRFFVSYVAPAFWNVAMIVTLVAGGFWFGLEGRSLVVALGWGALVGGGLQLAWQVPFVVASARGVRVSARWRTEGIREAVANFVPVVAARGVVNLSGWIDLILAGRLASGAVAVLGYAQTFYLLPISLFGMSIAASELPELSRMRGEAERVVAERVSTALTRIGYFLIPSALLYLALGDVVVATLYRTGAFGTAETLVTWAVLAGYALGLPASASSRVLSSAFYALRDARTPARVAYARVAVSTAAGVALMIPLDRVGVEGLRLGAAGLALGASLGAWVEYVWLRRALGARVGGHAPDRRRLLRYLGAAVLASAVGWGMRTLIPPMHPVLEGALILIPAGLAYLAAAGVRRPSAGKANGSARSGGG